MKTYWGCGGIATPIPDLGTRSASRRDRFIPRERSPGAHWIGGWVGPRAGLDAVVKRKIPSPYRDSTPESSSPTELSRLLQKDEWNRIYQDTNPSSQCHV
jgi:hypothetical protein